MSMGSIRFAVILGWSWIGLTVSAWAQSPVVELLPRETVVYFRQDGLDAHRDAYKETAASQAFDGSGLSEILERTLNRVAEKEEAVGIPSVFQHLTDYGFSVAIAVDPPQPGPLAVWGVVVVPEAGEGVGLLADLISSLKDEKLKVLSTRVQRRAVKYIQIPDAPVDFGWWNENGHLVLAFGMNGIASAIAVADGKRPHLEEHELFQKYSEFDNEVDVTQVAWFDVKSLRTMFADIPVPVKGDAEQVPLHQVLEILGLNTLEHVAAIGGFRGPSIWSEVIIDAPGERTGLLSLIDQPTFTIEDLPAIPLYQAGVAAFSFDWGNAYETYVGIIREITEIEGGEAEQKLDESLASFNKTFGFAPEELLNSLGSLQCLYLDRGQGMFGLGSVVMIQVDDADKLLGCADKIIEIVARSREQRPSKYPSIRKIERDDDTLIRIDPPEYALVYPTISIDENWVIFGLIPQAVEAQRLRMNGELYSWSLETDLADALKLLPEEMTSLVVVDPTVGYRELVGFAPVFIGAFEEGLRKSGTLEPDQKLPIDAGDFPPAERVTEPLFMNVTVSTVGENGAQIYSRRSLPFFPFLGEKRKLPTPAGSEVVIRMIENQK